MRGLRRQAGFQCAGLPGVVGRQSDEADLFGVSRLKRRLSGRQLDGAGGDALLPGVGLLGDVAMDLLPGVGQVPVEHLAEARALVVVGRPVECLPAEVGERLLGRLGTGDGVAALPSAGRPAARCREAAAWRRRTGS
jgi:hypothetical protein